jgi:hypothetical protein
MLRDRKSLIAEVICHGCDEGTALWPKEISQSSANRSGYDANAIFQKKVSVSQLLTFIRNDRDWTLAKGDSVYIHVILRQLMTRLPARALPMYISRLLRLAGLPESGSGIEQAQVLPAMVKGRWYLAAACNHRPAPENGKDCAAGVVKP